MNTRRRKMMQKDKKKVERKRDFGCRCWWMSTRGHCYTWTPLYVAFYEFLDGGTFLLGKLYPFSCHRNRWKKAKNIYRSWNCAALWKFESEQVGEKIKKKKSGGGQDQGLDSKMRVEKDGGTE